MIVRVCSVVLRRTVVGADWRFDNLSGSHQHSDDGFRSGCRNVSQHQQQSFSGLHYKPWRSLKPQQIHYCGWHVCFKVHLLVGHSVPYTDIQYMRTVCCIWGRTIMVHMQIMWYFADFNILIRKIILNKFKFQPKSVLYLFLLFLGDFSLSVLIKFVLIKKKSISELQKQWMELQDNAIVSFHTLSR